MIRKKRSSKKFLRKILLHWQNNTHKDHLSHVMYNIVGVRIRCGTESASDKSRDNASTVTVAFPDPLPEQSATLGQDGIVKV